MADGALICLSHGFHVRNILYSPLYEQLASTMQITIALPPNVEVPAADAHLLRGGRVQQVVIRAHRYETAFLFLRKNVFAGRERTQTFNLISELERQKHPVMYRVAGWANAILGRMPVLGRLWQKVEARFIPGHEFDALLADVRPKVVITANYGTEALEVRLLRAAHRRRIPTLAIIPSWDNLSSKGVIGENPRHLAVWNPIMRKEAITLYGFADPSIHVCGGLQFDRYAEPLPVPERDAILTRLGIDPGRPFVVIGTITPRYFANNIDIVDIVNAAIEDGRLPANLQILVRLHPQVVDQNYFGEDLGPYRERAAKYSRIKLSVPRTMRWGAITPPTPEDGAELMTQLQFAAVSIMPASTLAIDACALGSPVIGVGFDGHQSRPYNESVRRTFDFTHYRRIVELGGLRIAESKEILISEIDAYLKDRSRDAAGRARIVESHLGTLDGGAWRRILAIVQRLVAPAS